MVNRAVISRMETRATTKRREWWGWFGSISWLFFMMYGHDNFMYGDLVNDGGSWYPFIFMAVFSLAVAAFGWYYGRNPEGLSRLAFFMTPAVIAITAVFALLPQPWGSVLFAFSPVFMAPAITRRVYGVIQTAKPERRLTRYMSGIAACVLAFTAWMLLGLPREIAFLIPALLAIPAWAGVRGYVALPEALPEISAFRIKKRWMLLLAAAVILLIWLEHEHAVIHTHFIIVGEETHETLLTVFSFLLPPTGFMLFAFISDKGYERAGFIAGMTLFLTGLLFASLPVSASGAALSPLLVADGLGGAYTEFFILTVPLFLFGRTKRPVFIASLGVALNLASSALGWKLEYWMPAPFLELGAPLVVSSAVLTAVFIALAFILFERHKEKTLAAALYALLREGGEEEAPAEGETPEKADAPEASAASLTEEEKAAARLLLDGLTLHEISRRLHINSTDVGALVKAVREKILGAEQAALSPVAKAYHLTPREADVLACLRKGMTNSEIAEALLVTEGTAKLHVHNLMPKLPNISRKEIPAWVEKFEQEIEQ